MALSDPSLRMWGRYEHTLDDKYRVIVPLKFRDKLGEEFVIQAGPDHHIRVYPMPIWDAMEEQLASMTFMDELNSDLTYLQRMFGNCEFVKSDRENRLTIPRHLREWAGLQENDTAIIIGNGTRIEIWSRQGWTSCTANFTQSQAAAAAARRLAGTLAPSTLVAQVEERGEPAP